MNTTVSQILAAQLLFLAEAFRIEGRKLTKAWSLKINKKLSPIRISS